MSRMEATIHKVQQGQTLASLVANYRLSSNAAIVETQKNASIRSQLAAGGELPAGLIVHIPPRAQGVLQARMHKLNEFKPVLSTHFDTLQELTSANLLPALNKDASPFHSDEVTSVLRDLEEFSRRSIDQIGAISGVFAEHGKAMSLTHVATSEDRALAASSANALAGLSWAISANGLSAWYSMWERDLWDGKWESRSSESALRSTEQYITTVRSIVVQQADRNFRESLSLQRRLQAE